MGHSKGRAAFLAVAIVSVALLLAMACAPGAQPSDTAGAPKAQPVEAKGYFFDIKGLGKLPNRYLLPGPDEKPKRGGVYEFLTNVETPHFDARFVESAGHAVTVSPGLDRFVGAVRDENPEVIRIGCDQYLCESWTVSDDATVWTFKVKQGVRWHSLPPVNGREFTAEDVKWSWEYLGASGSAIGGLFSDIKEMQVPDKYTLKITLKEPNPSLLSNFAARGVFVMAREVVDTHGDYKKHLVGTGPFMLKEYEPKVRYVWERNPNYWQKDKPYLDGFRHIVVPERTTREAAFRTGKADDYSVNLLQEATQLKQQLPKVNIVVSRSYHSPFHFAVKHDTPPFNDVRVRRALAMAIDNYRAIDVVFGGTAYIKMIPPPALLGYSEPPNLCELGKQNGIEWYCYNPQRAKQLLAEAGFPNGFKFSQPAVFFDYNAQHEGWLSFISEELMKNLNVELNLRKLDYSTYTGLVYQGTFDTVAMGFWWPAGLDPLFYADGFMRSDSPRNNYKIKDPTMDGIVAKMKRTKVGSPEMTELGRQAYLRTMDQAYFVHLPVPYNYSLHQPWVRNYMGDIQHGFASNGANRAEVWFDSIPQR